MGDEKTFFVVDILLFQTLDYEIAFLGIINS